MQEPVLNIVPVVARIFSYIIDLNLVPVTPGCAPQKKGEFEGEHDTGKHRSLPAWEILALSPLQSQNLQLDLKRTPRD